jgi:septum formation protein
MQVILASASPRRRELLSLLGLPFDVMTPDVDERLHHDRSPEEQVRMLADAKALWGENQFPAAVVIGSDTLIALDDAVLGKPASLEDAGHILRRLSGRDHMVYTAVALRNRHEQWRDVRVEAVRVRFRMLSDAEIERYLATGESLGKAGAYAIQGGGGSLVERIHGEYTAVVGLPLRLLVEMLRARGITVPVSVERLYETKPYPNWAKFASADDASEGRWIVDRRYC